MRGYSLIEIIFVIAIIGFLSSISISAFSKMRQVNQPKYASFVFADALKEASIKSKSSEEDSSWGVKINSSNIVVFSGSTYGSRSSSMDRIYDIPANLSFSGPTEIVFTKFYGLPSASGTTTFQNTFATSSVYVLASGAIGY